MTSPFRALFALLLASATARGQTAPSPAVPWIPPARSSAPAPAHPTELPARLERMATVALAEAVDLALKNSPVTRAAWHAARAADALVGSKRSAYYPSVELDANLTRQKQVALGGRFVTLLTTYGPSASLTWLLLDLGGRSGDVDEARRALEAANYSQNAVIQAVVLQVEAAYYDYQNAKAQLAAAESNVKDAAANLEAAEERHRAGVATIADVLQAKTARSSAQLALETAQGRIQTIRGALATALGVPANVPVDAAALPEEVPLDETGEAVDALIARAQERRPDLLAARAAVQKAESHSRSVRASGLPSLSAAGAWGRTFYVRSDYGSFGDSYSAALLFRWPIFTGLAKTYDLRKAEEEANAARAQSETAEQRVVLDVWTSYYDLKTAAQRVRTSRDLLASARQSAEVAAGRYRAGVGSILDLLAAQSALASARAQEAQARADWLVAVARLAYDTGSLGPLSGETPPDAPTKEGKEMS